MPLAPSSAQLAVVIPAGGGGTRLWPRSRKASPKQLLDIVEPGVSMLQMTARRVAPDLVAPQSLFVITNHRYAQQVREQLADVPPQNVIAEPVGRDSAPAIGLMTALIEKTLGPDAVIIVLPADHDIRDPAEFRAALAAAVEAAEQGYLVTLGLPPTSPETGFGYIHRGEPLQIGTAQIFHVQRFREKPDHVIAEQYVASGEYFWNAGMYIARVSTLRDLYRRLMPEMEPHLAELAAAHGTASETEVFERIFPKLTKISVDFAIAEKADKVAVVPAHIGWSDVGSWAGLAEVIQEQADAAGNITFGEARHGLLDTRNSLIYSPHKMVAIIGMEDVVVVDTPDAILVATKDRAKDVKRIVESLEKDGRLDLL